MRTAIALLLALVATACSEPQTVGPTPLRGDEHMSGYLVRQSDWRAVLDDGEEMFWSFASDGSCRAWIEGEGRADLHFALSKVVPQGTRRIDARWEAGAERLRLTEVTDPAGEPMRDMGFPLGWVDGKLRIDIDERRFLKHLD